MDLAYFLTVWCLFTRSLGEVNILRNSGEKLGYGNFVKFDNKYLADDDLKIRSFSVSCPAECALICLDETRCRSYNVGTELHHGRTTCELLSGDQFTSSSGLQPSSAFHHYGIKSPCLQAPCQNGAKCRPEYSNNDYACVCVPGYSGKDCQTDINECATSPCQNDATCTDQLNAFKCACVTGFTGNTCETNIDECASSPCLNGAGCSDLVNGYSCTCADGYTGTHCEITLKSCKLVKQYKSSAQTGTYKLIDTAGQVYQTYCHFGSLGSCQSGTWTLVMKINGASSTFKYDSGYWSNKNSYSPSNAKKGIDSSETKVSKTGSSLYALIADGQYRSTSVGRNQWKSLISGSSLQSYCNREGFNSCLATTCVRIGIINNQENDCLSPDSRLGFGGKGGGCGTYDNNSCGNEAMCSSDNGDKHLKAFGYILVDG